MTNDGPVLPDNEPEHDPAQGGPAATPAPGAQGGRSARPRFSETQAAKVTGKSRSVIQRARERGEFPNAERLDKGWAIPIEDLLAAGFEVKNGSGRPIDSPPARPAQGVPAATPSAGAPPAQANPELDRLREELKVRDIELAAEKARREVLERSAQDARRAFESYQAQLERSLRLIEAAQADAAQARQEAREATRPTFEPQPRLEPQSPSPSRQDAPRPEAHHTQEPPAPTPTIGKRVRRWFGN